MHSAETASKPYMFSGNELPQIPRAKETHFRVVMPSVRAVAWILGICIACLHVANAARIVIFELTGRARLGGLMPLVDVDTEGNLPTLFSVMTLFAAGALAALVAARERRAQGRFWKYWVGIAVIFGGLAVDEGCRIHEMIMPLGKLIANSGVFFFAWVIPAGIAIAVLTLVYFRMVFSWPAWFRNLGILSAALFISGALGMEMIGGQIAEKSGLNLHFQIVSAIEEFLEMTGVAVWICALLRYLQSGPSPIVVALEFRDKS